MIGNKISDAVVTTKTGSSCLEDWILVNSTELNDGEKGGFGFQF